MEDKVQRVNRDNSRRKRANSVGEMVIELYGERLEMEAEAMDENSPVDIEEISTIGISGDAGFPALVSTREDIPTAVAPAQDKR